MIDPKYVLQAPGVKKLTASVSPVPYYGILWTPATTPFSITITDYYGEQNTFLIDKYTPAIAPKIVSSIAPGNDLYLLHNKDKSSLPG